MAERVCAMGITAPPGARTNASPRKCLFQPVVARKGVRDRNGRQPPTCVRRRGATRGGGLGRGGDLSCHIIAQPQPRITFLGPFHWARTFEPPPEASLAAGCAAESMTRPPLWGGGSLSFAFSPSGPRRPHIVRAWEPSFGGILSPWGRENALPGSLGLVSHGLAREESRALRRGA